MTAGENKAVVARIAEMFNAGRLDSLGDCVGEALVLHTTLLAEPRGGIGDLRGMFGMVLTGFPGGKLEVEELTAEEDRVALRFVFSGTHTGTMRGNAPTGRTLQWREAMFFRFGADGKVAEIWHLINVMEVLEKMGVLPSPAARARIQTMVTAVRKVRSFFGAGR
jgi:steroid delta-isomerase-like uncharacterized protein